MYSKAATVQPYIIIVGPSLNNVTSAFVVINDNLYKSETVLLVLDFCFKSHHVVDANYPSETHHIWNLIQLLIYKLHTKSDIKIPFIQDCFSETSRTSM